MSKRIAFSNFNETVTSFIRNDASSARVWQLPDRSMTVAGTDETLNKAVSGSDGIYPGTSLHAIPVLNAGSTSFEFLNYGKMAAQTDLDRLALPKGLAVINWSVNLVNNWKWDNTDQRAEPFDVDFPMIGFELGGEGVLCHYTAPGSVPATSFHEINRFGGGVEGLSGVDSLATPVPFNQFKACIYASYASTTTPPAATDEDWWGGSGNTLEGVLNPLLWLNMEEAKGSAGYNLNEQARFSAYGVAGAYPVINFEKSNGSYDTKTVATTNSYVGQIGGNVYDGSGFQRTAQIAFITRGTMATNNVGQSILFSTSPTNTAGLAARLDITDDGSLNTFCPVRLEVNSVSGIPSYSSETSLAPAITGATSYSLQGASTSSGGANLLGFTNVTAGAFPFVFRGVHGHTAPTTPAILFISSKHNGASNWTALAAAELVMQVRNNTTVLVEVLGDGNTGFGVTGPTAKVQIRGANNAVSLLVEDDAGNDILSAGESGGARVVGFFGVTPVIRQVVATGSTADQIITALQNLGLFAQS